MWCDDRFSQRNKAIKTLRGGGVEQNLEKKFWLEIEISL